MGYEISGGRVVSYRTVLKERREMFYGDIS